MGSNSDFQDRGKRGFSVSLIVTILNEADQLPEFLDSIQKLTLVPTEIIVVDGGSCDESLLILDQWRDTLPLTVISCSSANISTGRNVAISEAEGEIVAVTDAGVVLHPGWLQELILPFTQSVLPIDAVGGFYVPDARNRFEAALAASTLPDVEEIVPNTFMPSSRSFAFRRSWFEAGVRYPEWLDYCEDLILDMRLKRAGAVFAFQPNAEVRFRPRGTVLDFWRQYYRYARGDGRAGLFWKRHALRYLAYLVVLPSLFVSPSWVWRVLVVLAGVLYMRKPVQRLARREELSIRTIVPLVALSTLLRGIGDVAKMIGYPVGLWWRAKRYGLLKDWRSIPERASSDEA